MAYVPVTATPTAVPNLTAGVQYTVQSKTPRYKVRLLPAAAVPDADSEDFYHLDPMTDEETPETAVSLESGESLYAWVTPRSGETEVAAAIGVFRSP